MDENHKRQHVCSTSPKFGYGLYTLQSEGEELTGYYLVNAGAEQVGAELSKGQDLVRWSGYRTRITFLFFIYPIYILNFFSFLTTSFPGIHALSYEGFAGAEVVTVGLPPPPPGAPGGNWGATWNLWTPVKVCKSQYA